MKVTLKRDQLHKALQTVRRVVPSKPQLPILQAVLVSAANNEIEISATDLYTGIRTKVAGMVEAPGTIAIPAQAFADTIANLGSGSVTLEYDDGKVALSSEGTSVSIQTFSGEEYPAFPDKQGTAIQLSAEDFQIIVNAVTFSTAKDDTRPILTAVNFVFGEKMQVVSTDGFRLSVLSLDQTIDAPHLLVPAKALHEVARLQNKHEPDVVEFTVSQELKQLFCSFSDTEVVVRLLEGEYPPYEKIIPPAFSIEALFDGDQFLQALKGAVVFAREASNIVKLELTADTLKLSSSSPSLGTHQAEVPAKVTGTTPAEIAFNAQYLLEFMSALKPGEMWFGMNESLQPAAMRPSELTSYQYIVMPFRLNE